MGYFIKNLQSQDGLISNLYTGTNVAQLTQFLHQMMAQIGYSVKEEQPGTITYEKGNRVMRILFGAFVKYFKFTVTIVQTAENEITINIFKQSSGVSGGLIGMNQVKNEMKMIGTMMETL